MIEIIKDDWLVEFNFPMQKPKLRLFCFPFAGGGTLNYAKWRKDLSPDISLCAFNLPGRERLINEPFITDFKFLIENCAKLIQKKSDLPIIFFGHSFGGLTAYFTTLELQKNKLITPDNLYISATFTPQSTKLDKIGDINKDEFLEILVKRYQGIPMAILENPELLNFFMPIIQGDFRMYEQHPDVLQNYYDLKVSCDITTFGYSQDLTKEEDFQQWQNFTLGCHKHIPLKGGHFELLNNWSSVVELLNEVVMH